ncbi:YjfB family protein [Scatolibacter rhodanostii]|uniref:YjfB family protein n=1 Tax=Scatolibacter rhodanostii TaxID=2014781 RepID=UPI000C0872A3|nr:YjfB family protein [Scatolibacter rhodanostii]
MDIMAISAANVDVSAANWQQTASISLLDKAMDIQENQGAAIMEMMPPVSFGHQLDIYI